MYRMRQGDFVFNRIDTDKGAFGVVDSKMSGAVASNEFPAYVCDQSQLLSEYLWLHFQQETVLGALRAAGSEGRARWKEADFERHTILLPSLAEQRRIVDLIGALDETIEAASIAQEESDRAFRESRAQLCQPRQGSRSLPEVSENLDNSRIPISKTVRSTRPGQIPYYGASGRTGWINEALFDEPLVCLGEDGAGLLHWKTRPIAYRIDGASWVNNHAHVLRATSVSTDWLALTLMHYDISLLVNKGTRPKLNKGMLDQIRVRVDDRVPQDEELLLAQKDVAGECAAVESALRILRTNLLTALLSGEHEIPSSYDEHLGVVA
ncbi:restriction endonuclease subunit S [Cryobacterium lyxosi]|nr:restriction endonuclease subunit S [Cryobacterium lyxosi]